MPYPSAIADGSGPPSLPGLSRIADFRFTGVFTFQNPDQCCPSEQYLALPKVIDLGQVDLRRQTCLRSYTAADFVPQFGQNRSVGFTDV